MSSEVDSQKVYWDRVAGEKRFSHPLRADWLRRYLESNSRIVDYGCGYGRTLRDLHQAGFTNLIGIDFSTEMLARAQAEVPVSRLIRNDGRTFPLQSASFDAVLLFALLTCIPNSDEQRQQLAEVQRVLRPGGLLYISDLLINTDERNLERYEKYAEAYGSFGVFELPEGVVVRHHTKNWIDELTSPFERLHYEPFTVITMNGHESAAFQYLGRKKN